MPPFIQRSSSVHNKPTAVASGALRSSARGGGLSADARVAPDGDCHVNQRSRSSAALQTGSPRATVDRARHDALLPASEPSVGRRTPPATVDRGAGAGRWRMDRADPIVRAIEGATQIDSFSRVGTRVPPAAGTPGARRGAATSAAPVVASIPVSSVTSTGTSTGASIGASSVRRRRMAAPFHADDAQRRSPADEPRAIGARGPLSARRRRRAAVGAARAGRRVGPARIAAQCRRAEAEPGHACGDGVSNCRAARQNRADRRRDARRLGRLDR